MLRSLRFRLATLSTVIIAVALVAAGVLLHAQLGASLLSSIDDSASSEAFAAASDVNAGRLAAAGNVGDEDTVVQIVDRFGVPIASSRNIRGQISAFSFRATPGVTFHNTARLPIRQSADFYRVAAIGTRSGDSVYVAVASDDRHDTLQSLDSALLVGIPIVLVMLALAAWFAIGRALRPVERLRRQAEAISETALDRRLAAPSTTELRILADTLNDLLDRVDHAVTRQREFVADAAHELRSPLASLRTQIEVGDRDAPPDSRELIRQVDRLSRLVDDLLALAKVDEADPSQGVAVDLDDVVLECVADIRTRSAVQIDVSAVSAAQTTGHRSALERLVRNLIQNAVQHATTGVAVTLATRGHEVELVVADDGPGIPPADRQRVFERFTRLDSSRDRASGGVGLGLAIAAEVVAAHDGEIDIHDNAPGAAFVVRLPAAVPTPLRSAQQVDGVPV